MIKYIFKTILIFTGLIFLVSPVFATSVAAEKTTEVGQKILQKLEVNPSLASKIVGSADDISRLSPEDKLKALKGIQRTGKVFEVKSYIYLKNLNSALTLDDYFKILDNSFSDPSKILALSKQNGRIILLDEGNSEFGMEHIKLRHVAGYPPHPISGKGSLFKTNNLDDIKSSIMKVVDDPNANIYMGNNGRYVYESTVQFYDLQWQKIRVIVSPEGNIISAFPF